MSTLTESHARLSEKSYSPHHDRIDIEDFELVQELGTPAGYHGVIYRNVKTRDYVVAHTGTEFEPTSSATDC